MEVYYICCFKKWKTNRLINQPTITSNNFYSRTQGVTRFVTFETEKHMIMDWGRLKGYYHFSFSAPIPLENLPPVIYSLYHPYVIKKRFFAGIVTNI